MEKALSAILVFQSLKTPNIPLVLEVLSEGGRKKCFFHRKVLFSGKSAGCNVLSATESNITLKNTLGLSAQLLIESNFSSKHSSGL